MGNVRLLGGLRAFFVLVQLAGRLYETHSNRDESSFMQNVPFHSNVASLGTRFSSSHPLFLRHNVNLLVVCYKQS